MNLKIMRLVLRVPYSTIPAPLPAQLDGVMLTVDRVPQIPRRPTGSRLRRGLTYRDGLRLDLHLPVTAGPHPLVVYVPGGGFVVAPRRMARRQRGYVAAAGYAVASVEYRTTRKQATYTDGIADIQSAITYLSGHADEFAIDPDRIGIWGESAGGYLASLVGLTDPRIRAVVDQFGASDLSHAADGFDLRMHAKVADPRHPIHRYGAVRANPADLVHPAAPPFLLMHGDDDRIITPAQTGLLQRALVGAGGDSTRYVLAGAGHGQLSLTGRQAKQWTSVQVLTTIRDFLDQKLRT
ncbi:MAG TPA: alpha/beta hydrolase [Streptosporangiaceae bacterium]|nr:alpha/beta hydrolase [Streptosporangiaceae bacterium]